MRHSPVDAFAAFFELSSSGGSVTGAGWAQSQGWKAYDCFLGDAYIHTCIHACIHNNNTHATPPVKSSQGTRLFLLCARDAAGTTPAAADRRRAPRTHEAKAGPAASRGRRPSGVTDVGQGYSRLRLGNSDCQILSRDRSFWCVRCVSLFDITVHQDVSRSGWRFR